MCLHHNRLAIIIDVYGYHAINKQRNQCRRRRAELQQMSCIKQTLSTDLMTHSLANAHNTTVTLNSSHDKVMTNIVIFHRYEQFVLLLTNTRLHHLRCYWNSGAARQESRKNSFRVNSHFLAVFSKVIIVFCPLPIPCSQDGVSYIFLREDLHQGVRLMTSISSHVIEWNIKVELHTSYTCPTSHDPLTTYHISFTSIQDCLQRRI